MSDKKLTDSEIIKALGDCLHRSCNVCIRRPEEYGATERQCSRGLMKDALSLINRLQAENERLKDTLNATIAGQETLQRYITTAKAEAVKEFAERLKEKYKPYVILGSEVAEIEIDNLLKEMLGENNETKTF